MIKDVIVNITRKTSALSQQGFGLILILAVNADKEYKEYSELHEVEADYANSTEAYKLVAALFAQNPRPDKVAIFGVSYVAESDSASKLSSALNELILSHSDFYILTSEVQGDNEITELSNWCNTQDKMYFATTTNKSLATTLGSNDRTALYYTDEGTNYLAERIVAANIFNEPGTITWKFKRAVGAKPVILSTTDLKQLRDDHCNTFITDAGVNITTDGVVASGEYIDIIMAIDWIKAKMTERIKYVLYNSDKVSFDNKGISKIISALETVLKEAAEKDILLKDENGIPQYSVKAPTRQTTDANDIAQRKLKKVNWTAKLDGAIEIIEINGTVTY